MGELYEVRHPFGILFHGQCALQGVCYRLTPACGLLTPTGFCRFDGRAIVVPKDGKSLFLAEGKCRSQGRTIAVPKGGQMSFLREDNRRSQGRANVVPKGGQSPFLGVGNYHSRGSSCRS